MARRLLSSRWPPRVGHQPRPQPGQVQAGLPAGQFFLNRQQIGLRRHARGHHLRALVPAVLAAGPRGVGRPRSFLSETLLRVAPRGKSPYKVCSRIASSLASARFVSACCTRTRGSAPAATRSVISLQLQLSQLDCFCCGRGFGRAGRFQPAERRISDEPARQGTIRA